MYGWCRRGWARSATLVVLAAAVFGPAAARADFDQPTEGTRYPTAGILAHREYRLEARAGAESSLLVGARVGFMDVMQAGLFGGAQHLLDRSDIVTNPHLGFEVRVRVLPETTRPALALGFDSQGWGRYDGAKQRYERKSPGFYAVASKNWHSFAGDLSLHAGVDYSLERKDHDDKLDGFASGDWTIARRVSILCDVDPAFNDNRRDGSYGEGGAYVDAGLRVRLGENVSLMLVFSDISGVAAGGKSAGRELEMAYNDSF